MEAMIIGPFLVQRSIRREKEWIMKLHREAIGAAFGLVLAVVAMAGTIHTDLYAQAAGAAARGDQALIQTMVRP
jgi:hypothetical protein